MISNRPSFQKIHYMFRPRKQVERKIMIEVLQELQTALNIQLAGYQYVGLGSIYYYDFILFNKYLNITDMISLDYEPCVQRFEFNAPFDFVRFKNVTTTAFLESQPPSIAKNRLIWFDYDSRLILANETRGKRGTVRQFRLNRSILDDIGVLTRKSRANDLFILTVSLDIPSKVFFNVRVRNQFLEQFKPYLSGKHKCVADVKFENYRYIVQNIILNSFKNNETNQALKFRKLFSFAYGDTTPMYTIGGIYRSEDLDSSLLRSEFFQPDEDNVTGIDVPLLTYREKLKLDQAVDFFGQEFEKAQSDDNLSQLAAEKLGFELECLDLRNYIKYYRYYPQYYEGII